MIISLITAKDKRGLIGIRDEMPWHLPEDFKHFKRTTIGHPIIMGRKTFESIGSKPLPKRPHIIVSRNPDIKYDSVQMASSVEGAIGIASTMDREECFICGGGEIYSYALKEDLVDLMYITIVDTIINIDEWEQSQAIYFPNSIIDENWELLSDIRFEADEKNEYSMNFLLYERNII